MAILLLAEHDGSVLLDQTARALAAALEIGSDVDILVAGKDIGAVAETAAGLAGVRTVLKADADDLDHQLPEAIAALVLQLAEGYDTIAAPATSLGKSAMPRVAALLDVMQISDVIAVLAPDTFKRPIYAGNAIQIVQSSDARRVLTVRTSAFAPVAATGAAAIETVAFAPAEARSRFIEEQRGKSARPELGAARIVVSGGRALGSAENFQTRVVALADVLGAAVGASRAPVDEGYAPNDWQVGQTGKIVAPELYIAVGISGAIQHVAGMKDAKTIVAINSDANAPIFQYADYGLVGDLFELVPQLTAALAQTRS
ncbi:MAG: electron transfer flavoprotein subunit alpha/FixB family protein [Devosia sp.]|nr:electron transfer flavoprotein subunit alpha/FixB family protein [Devosia sp.]